MKVVSDRNCTLRFNSFNFGKIYVDIPQVVTNIVFRHIFQYNMLFCSKSVQTLNCSYFSINYDNDTDNCRTPCMQLDVSLLQKEWPCLLSIEIRHIFFVWGKHMDLIQSLMLLFKLKTVTQCVPERTLTLKGQNVKVVVNRL